MNEVVSQVKHIVEGEFRNLLIEGAVSNWSRSSSGHIYFSLSDDKAMLSCAFFRGDVLRSKGVERIKNGDKLKCFGSIGIYTKRGTFQLIVKSVEVVGKGGLKEQFEELKAKLGGEGIFDMAKKIPIPPLPKKIAVVTAPTAAAFQDFLNVYKRRSIWADIVISPAVVQGDGAPNSIIKALERIVRFSEKSDSPPEVIVLTRGGGSLEDLWAFNDERLARYIYKCKIPIISAVGHQVDYSISDYVADFRAETPSAAAEILSEEQKKIVEKMISCRKGLISSISSRVNDASRRVERNNPQMFATQMWKLLSTFNRRLSACDTSNRMRELAGIFEKSSILDELYSDINSNMKDITSETRHRLELLSESLANLNPKRVLERGYSMLSDVNGNVVGDLASFEELSKDAEVGVHFHDGDAKLLKKDV